MRQHVAEGRDWLARALAGAPARTTAWARAELGAGVLARDLDDVTAARTHLEASIACSRARGESELLAWGLRDLGMLCVDLSELEQAATLLAEGVALSRAAGDQRGIAAALMILAKVAALGGDAARAQALATESLTAARLAGDRWLLSAVLLRLGAAAVDRADPRAAPILEEGRALSRDLGLPGRVAQFEFQLGRLALAGGDVEGVVPLVEALVATSRDQDSPDAVTGLATSLGELGRVALARGRAAEGATLLRQALRLRRDAGDRLGAVEFVDALAAAAPTTPHRAARLLGAARAARRAPGAPPPPRLQPALAAARRAAREGAGRAAFDAALAAGAALPLDEAIREALDEPRPPH